MRKWALVFMLLATAPPVQALDFGRTQKHAVLVGSAGGDAEYTKKHWELLSRMYRVLTDKLDFAPEQVYLLFEDVKPDPKIIRARSTKVEVEKLFGDLAKKLTENDLLLVMIVGHGTFDGEAAKINLPGPDITDKDLARMVKATKAKYRVIVNAASASGEFLKSLSGKNTVVITATKSGMEKTDTLFPKFFIEAFDTSEADTNKDGVVSLVEAFEYAVRKVEKAFKDDGKLLTEHALLDDSGKGAGLHTLDAKAGQGALARALILGRAGTGTAAADASDPQLRRLLAQRKETENRIDELKAKKDQMAAEQYQSEFEKLALQLARINRQIKQASGQKEP